MKISCVGIWVLSFLLVPAIFLNADNLETFYKKVGEELVAIRQEFPQSQPKVYRILDHVDQLYKKAETAMKKKEELVAQKDALTAQLTKHNQEMTTLQQEVAQLKQAFEKNQQELARAHARLKQEQGRVVDLAKQKKVLQQKKHVDICAEENAEQPLLADQEKIEEKSSDELLSMINDDDLQNLNLTSTSDPMSPR
ncbi:hypothetical protein IPF37_03065 [bacterium]|nr:MAG: hypothetical protein IPF37_03065 [bacterium]